MAVTPLSWKIARKYAHKVKCEAEELQSTAMLYFIERFHYYDENLGMITTFAYRLLTQGILEYIDKVIKGYQHRDVNATAILNDVHPSLNEAFDSSCTPYVMDMNDVYTVEADLERLPEFRNAINNMSKVSRLVTDYVVRYADLNPELYEMPVMELRKEVKKLMKEEIGLSDWSISEIFREVRRVLREV
jgi:hypothetical protein